MAYLSGYKWRKASDGRMSSEALVSLPKEESHRSFCHGCVVSGCDGKLLLPPVGSNSWDGGACVVKSRPSGLPRVYSVLTKATNSSHSGVVELVDCYLRVSSSE